MNYTTPVIGCTEQMAPIVGCWVYKGFTLDIPLVCHSYILRYTLNMP